MMIAFAAFTFTSCEDVPAPYEIPSDSDDDNPTEEVQPSGSGTLSDPYNVAAIIQEAEKLASGESSTQDYYFKGKVKSIKEQYSSNYGNGTFYITDENSSNSFYVYRAMYLGNKKFTDGNTEIVEGDEVIICGKITNYSGTLETVQNGAYLYSLNGKTSSDGGSDNPDTPSGDATGDGTLANPYNCVAANNYASSLAANAVSENAVYIKGVIASYKENFSTQYGNASFYISDDGTSTNQFYVFRTYYLNNEKYTSGDVPQVGDTVIVYGNVTNYYGNTPETAQGKSYIYQWNKSNNGGGNTGGDDNTGDQSASNGNFESWSNGLPTNWKSTSTASNADLSQSTDAHSGSYSVKVGGSSSANKRLSYKELTLKAGEYTMTFYVKAATSTGGSIRPGYATVVNGSISGGDAYQYGSYVNDISSTEWLQVTHTFTISSEGTYCVLIMNAKKPGGDVLIDDFKLVMGSTTIIE